MIIDYDKPETIQILMKAFDSKNYRKGSLFYMCVTFFVVPMRSQKGVTFRFLRFRNFVQEKRLIILSWHQFLNELVILN